MIQRQIQIFRPHLVFISTLYSLYNTFVLFLDKLVQSSLCSDLPHSRMDSHCVFSVIKYLTLKRLEGILHIYSKYLETALFDSPLPLHSEHVDLMLIRNTSLPGMDLRKTICLSLTSSTRIQTALIQVKKTS